MAQPFYEKVDWIVVMTALILAAISLLTIYSASSSGSGQQDVVIKQAGWFVIGFLLITAVTSIDYHLFSVLAYSFYGTVLLSLGQS
jgi:cell division protein FtsW (lipid II flippase)